MDTQQVYCNVTVIDSEIKKEPRNYRVSIDGKRIPIYKSVNEATPVRFEAGKHRFEIKVAGTDEHYEGDFDLLGDAVIEVFKVFNSGTLRLHQKIYPPFLKEKHFTHYFEVVAEGDKSFNDLTFLTVLTTPYTLILDDKTEFHLYEGEKIRIYVNDEEGHTLSVPQFEKTFVLTKENSIHANIVKSKKSFFRTNTVMEQVTPGSISSSFVRSYEYLADTKPVIFYSGGLSFSRLYFSQAGYDGFYRTNGYGNFYSAQYENGTLALEVMDRNSVDIHPSFIKTNPSEEFTPEITNAEFEIKLENHNFEFIKNQIEELRQNNPMYPSIVAIKNEFAEKKRKAEEEKAEKERLEAIRIAGYKDQFGIEQKIEFDLEKGIFHIRKGYATFSEDFPVSCIAKCECKEIPYHSKNIAMTAGALTGNTKTMMLGAASSLGNYDEVSSVEVWLTLQQEDNISVEKVVFASAMFGLNKSEKEYSDAMMEYAKLEQYMKVNKICQNKQEQTSGNEAPTQQKQDIKELVAQLRELKVLVDEGILTEEEFAAKKKQLLGI